VRRIYRSILNIRIDLIFNHGRTIYVSLNFDSHFIKNQNFASFYEVYPLNAYTETFYTHTCVRACVRACARARVCVCVCIKYLQCAFPHIFWNCIKSIYIWKKKYRLLHWEDFQFYCNPYSIFLILYSKSILYSIFYTHRRTSKLYGIWWTPTVSALCIRMHPCNRLNIQEVICD